jgi:holdfast attachment protein HfaA
MAPQTGETSDSLEIELAWRLLSPWSRESRVGDIIVIRSFTTTVVGVLALTFAAAGAANAQTQSRLGDFERPVGFEYGGIDDPIEASTRDANGNRVVINGRITQSQGSLYGGLMDSDAGDPFAIGNQLNVVTQGNWNTVIIDSTQINNGDVTAVMQGDQQ